MKKAMKLWIIVIMLTILTACGADRNHEEAGTQAEKEKSEHRSGAEEPDSTTNEVGGNPVSSDHEYEKITVTYCEPMGGFSFRKDLEKTQTDYADYYFESSISVQERNECIEATDRMLSCIDALLPNLEVVVLEQKSYDGVSISGNRLYLSIQPWDSVDYLAKVLLAGYGEWGNYGLAYGYADYLYRKAGLDSEEANSAGGSMNADGGEADGFLPMSALELYDLNLLCFDEKFVSPQDVKASKNNARLFVKDYLSSHSEEEFLELLTASGTVEGIVQAKEALETFYAENGVECSLSGIRYQYGGSAFDYGTACEYACFYVDKDWQDAVWEMNPMVSENFLHEKYGEVRAFFECYEQQMLQYQELFGFDSYDNTLSIIFSKHLYKAASIYFGGSHTIQLLSVASLTHEYIHSVMFGRFVDWESLWKTEGFARYFSNKYDLYNYDSLNDDWNNASVIWVQEYIDAIGRPIDVQTDYSEILHIAVHAMGVTNPDFSYTTGASFIGYLVSRYGEQAVIAYVCSDNDYNEEWDKSYDELVQDWNQFIEENYSQYSMNGGK